MKLFIILPLDMYNIVAEVNTAAAMRNNYAWLKTPMFIFSLNWLFITNSMTVQVFTCIIQ
jgi:hypothetical protein